jgi:hypothetical protein
MMTDLSKIDLVKAQSSMGNQDHTATKLERADLSRCAPGQTLPHQLGHRLRTIFLVPKTQEDAFDSLLKQISNRLP